MTQEATEEIRPVPVERHGTRSESTRLLCAGAYIDEDYAEQVLEEVLFHPYRAVAPSYGVDVIPVVRHCLAARRLTLARDLIITALIVFSLVFAFLETMAVILGLLSLWCLWRAAKALNLGNPLNPDTSQILLNVLLAILCGIGLAIFTTMRAINSAGWPLTLPQTTNVGGATVPGAWIVLLLIWAVHAIAEMIRHATLLHDLSPGKFDPTRAPRENLHHRERLQYLAASQHGNVTFYAQPRTPRPFVGAGNMARSWSFAVPLVPDEAPGPGTPVPPERVDVWSFYQMLEAAMVEIARPDLPVNERVPRLSLDDRIFSGGVMRFDDASLDPERHRPVTVVDENEMTKVIEAERGTRRHYRTIRVMTWNGEVEVTAFVHFAVQGNMLYTEFVATVMPGVRSEFKYSNVLPRKTRFLIYTALKLLVTLIPTAATAPLRLLHRIRSAVERQLERGQRAESRSRNMAFDYGAVNGIRELGAIKQAYAYFQILDATRYIRILERTTIAAAQDVLRENGYSVTELTTRIDTLTIWGGVPGMPTVNEGPLPPQH